jgi:predicted permease
MPTAVFPIVLARHYQGDPATAMRVVIGTSVVGLVTIPLWIRFGMKFVGL